MEKTTEHTAEIIIDKISRLDVLLAEKLACSRAYAQKLLKEGFVFLKGKQDRVINKTGYQTIPGQIFQINLPAPKAVKFTSEKRDLDVIYEDEDLLLINKPAGLIVHPAGKVTSETLVNALLHHCRNLSAIGGYIRPGIVHRLDKDTSGVMVIAKNDLTHQNLSAQFASHQIKKTYLALVHGRMEYQKGKITGAIARGQSDRTKMRVTAMGGRQAVTHFEATKQFKNMTLLRIFPQTGRTHQIRVHLAYIKHPIVGDRKYGKNRDSDVAKRQMLHAESISFLHPTKLTQVKFQAQLPADLKEVMKVNEIS